jgi:hypothetical protein
MKQHERDAWNNRPMTVTIKELCEGGCNELKTDVEARAQEVYCPHLYKWQWVKSKCCKACFDAQCQTTRDQQYVAADSR